MPELDYMVVCDYARTDNGVTHIIAAGIDQVRAPQLPMVHTLGIAVRVSVGREESSDEHRIEVVIAAPDDGRVVGLRGVLQQPWAEGEGPERWPALFSLSPNVAVPFQTYGPHRVELWINDQLVKSVEIRVEPPPEG